MCEYCYGENLSSTPISEQGDLELPITTIIDDGFLYNFCVNGQESVIGINFCPMCGREFEFEWKE